MTKSSTLLCHHCLCNKLHGGVSTHEDRVDNVPARNSLQQVKRYRTNTNKPEETQIYER